MPESGPSIPRHRRRLRVWLAAAAVAVLVVAGGLVLARSGGDPSPGASGGAPRAATGGAPDLARVEWDGGPAYYARYPTMAAWSDPGFLPIGVWFQSVLDESDVASDRAAGINTYVELTAESRPELIRAAGSYAIPHGLAGEGPETVARLLTDEADMTYGPGSDPWSGRPGWNTCVPAQDAGGQCGYTVMRTFNDRAPDDGRPRYANYGKGVMMWQSDADAQVFVNSYQQLVSADMYFYTDHGLCPHEAPQSLGIAADKCRRSSSYGLVLDRMRKLDAMDGRRQPIFAFVEVGHPASEDDAPTITGDQIAGAVMNSMIHQARGVVYFNHSFGGGCPSQHVLRDRCGAAVRAKVTETNHRLTRLAPVLNTQSYQFVANRLLDTMLKFHDGSYYLFAMPGRNGGEGSQTLRLPDGVHARTAEVLFENRSVAIRDGAFTDTFGHEHTYHIYKITP